MKTFKLQKVSEIYEEIVLNAESLEQAKEIALDSDEWESDGPYLVKEQYKVIESSGDIELDYNELDEEDWNVTYDSNSDD